MVEGHTPHTLGIRLTCTSSASLTRCSTHHAPWYVIPADRNWVRNAAISHIVRETLEEMNPKYPEPKGWDPKAVKVV